MVNGRAYLAPSLAISLVAACGASALYQEAASGGVGGAGATGGTGGASSSTTTSVTSSVTSGSGAGGSAACAVSIRAGEYHACAQLAGGSVWCWGLNRYGQIGDGAVDGVDCGYDQKCQFAPTKAVALGTGVADVFLGLGEHGCARKTDGSFACWGQNGGAQLGGGAADGQTCWDGGKCRPAPVAVTAPAGVTFAGVATGYAQTCAYDTGGGLWCWGDETWGQLGNGVFGLADGGASIIQPAPVQVSGIGAVAQVVVSRLHACAATKDGAMWCWGRNDEGMLGDGTTDGVPCLGWKCKPYPVQVAGLDHVVEIALGGAHSCARRDDKTLWCWGDNSAGELGDGTTLPRAAPVQVTALGAGVVQVALGGLHSCALLDDGSVWCWGFDYEGELGDGTTTQDGSFGKPSPVKVLLPGSAVEIAAGDSFTCARTAAGEVWCWGSNAEGELARPSVQIPAIERVALPCPG